MNRCYLCKCKCTESTNYIHWRFSIYYCSKLYGCFQEWLRIFYLVSIVTLGIGDAEKNGRWPLVFVLEHVERKMKGCLMIIRALLKLWKSLPKNLCLYYNGFFGDGESHFSRVHWLIGESIGLQLRHARLRSFYRVPNNKKGRKSLHPSI